MDLETFAKGFYFVTLTYIHDDFFYSFFERLESNSQDESFYFTLPQNAAGREFFVGLDFYTKRMYPYQCQKDVSATLSLSFNDKIIKQEYVENQNGFGFIWIADQEAKAGKYELKVSNLNFESDTVKDFVVNVYASERVAITDN